MKQSAKALEMIRSISEAEAVDLCRDLVRMKTVNPPGDETALAEYAAAVLKKAGLEVELLKHSATRASVLARLGSSRQIPSLVYNGHLDTVPIGAEAWDRDPFSGEVADGRIWGRGASDMKGGVAAIIVAAKTIARSRLPIRGDLIVALTAGEEIDSLGAKSVASLPHIGPLRAIVIPEPSHNELYVAEKGALWLEVSTRGKTAHGSMPDLGKNAVLMMVDLIQELQKTSFPCQEHPLLGGYSLSINTISGGMKTNVVPDHCAITIDMRTVPGQNHESIVAAIEDLIARLNSRNRDFKAAVKITNDRVPIETPLGAPAVREFSGFVEELTGTRPAPKGVRYYTDAATLVPAFGAPMIICGPGDPRMAHQPNEYVEIKKVVESAQILTLAAGGWLA